MPTTLRPATAGPKSFVHAARCTVDGNLRLLRASRGFASLLGRPPADLLGRPLLSLLGVVRDRAEARKVLTDPPPQGATIALDARLGGQRASLEIRVRPLKSGGREVQLEASSGAASGLLAPDLAYEISTAEATFGALSAVSAPDEGAGWSSGRLGERCFRAFHGREQPCEGCPVRSSEPAGVITSDRTECALLVLSEPLAGERARVRATWLSPEFVSAVLRARLAELAHEAGLSRREREVLHLMHLGRSLGEMGVALGISSRTAKFHQANALSKLGADSRHDLLRQLL